MRWVYFIVLVLIWGSVFLLIKKALIGFSSIEVSVLRIMLPSVLLIFVTIKSFCKITKNDLKWIILSALLGTMSTIYALPFIQTKLNSSVVGVLVSMFPVVTAIFGKLLFNYQITIRRGIGIVLGLIAISQMIILPYILDDNMKLTDQLSILHVGLLIVTVIMFSINLFIIKKKLTHISSINLVAMTYTVAAIMSIPILLSQEEITSLNFLTNESFPYVLALAVFGSILGKWLYNNVIRLFSHVEASSTSYLIPFVAVVLGWLDGESISLFQLSCFICIIFSIYLISKE